MTYRGSRNPYDFANPVSQLEVFAGRQKELEEIDYYLDHARKSARAIHLALIGERASGKTSLLNMIEIKATKLHFAVGRVDLDESDSTSELYFFQRIFDAILTAACSEGAFGGLEGAAYGAYREMVDTYEIPADPIFHTFRFPAQFARAMDKGRMNAIVSPSGLREDLKAIHSRFDRPIILLFDECDVLTTSRTHLQKLRNMFQNLAGFMLVLTGTPNLFPTLNDVFSPMIRQFKKIEVLPFVAASDTTSCVMKPLEELGITRPQEIFDFETYQEIEEIHELSGGRPYEIQLLCHFMFRPVELGHSEVMELSLEVLEAVRHELETTQDVDSRPILRKVRTYEQRQLEALGRLCACSGRASLEQLWFAERVFPSREPFSLEELENFLSQFRREGLISEDTSLIGFLGDDFDRLYIKYYAQKKRARPFIDNRSVVDYFSMRLNSFVLSNTNSYRPLSMLAFTESREAAIGPALSDFTQLDWHGDPWKDNSFEAAYATYWSSIPAQLQDSFDITVVTVEGAGAVFRQVFVPTASSAKHSNGFDFSATILEAHLRANELGGRVSSETLSLPTVSVELLAQSVDEMEDKILQDLIKAQHYSRMIQAYVEHRDAETARLHALLLLRYGPQKALMNNLGYVLLSAGDFENARVALGAAVIDEDDLLAGYNLGVLEAFEGNIKLALKLIEGVSDKLRIEGSESIACRCLIVPRYSTDMKRIEFPEELDPTFSDATARTISALRSAAESL